MYMYIYIYSLNSLSVRVPYNAMPCSVMLSTAMLVSLSHGAQIDRSSSWTRARGPELVDPSLVALASIRIPGAEIGGPSSWTRPSGPELVDPSSWT